MNQISEWVDIKHKLKLTKIAGVTMGDPPKRALQNSNFLTFSASHTDFLK